MCRMSNLNEINILREMDKIFERIFFKEKPQMEEIFHPKLFKEPLAFICLQNLQCFS